MKWVTAKQSKSFVRKINTGYWVAYCEVKWDAFDWLFANPWDANFLQCRHFLFSVEPIFRSKIACPTFGTIFTKIAQPFFGNQNKVFLTRRRRLCQKVKIRESLPLEESRKTSTL